MRADIKCFADLGKTTTKMLKLLEKRKGNMSASRVIVFKWYHRFKDGRQNIEDDERRSREPVIHTSIAASIKTALKGDRHLTIRELSEVTDVSRGKVHCILANVLNMKKDIYYITLIK